MSATSELDAIEADVRAFASTLRRHIVTRGIRSPLQRPFRPFDNLLKSTARCHVGVARFLDAMEITRDMTISNVPDLRGTCEFTQTPFPHALVVRTLPSGEVRFRVSPEYVRLFASCYWLLFWELSLYSRAISRAGSPDDEWELLVVDVIHKTRMCYKNVEAYVRNARGEAVDHESVETGDVEEVVMSEPA